MSERVLLVGATPTTAWWDMQITRPAGCDCFHSSAKRATSASTSATPSVYAVCRAASSSADTARATSGRRKGTAHTSSSSPTGTRHSAARSRVRELTTRTFIRRSRLCSTSSWAMLSWLPAVITTCRHPASLACARKSQYCFFAVADGVVVSKMSPLTNNTSTPFSLITPSNHAENLSNSSVRLVSNSIFPKCQSDVCSILISRVSSIIPHPPPDFKTIRSATRKRDAEAPKDVVH